MTRSNRAPSRLRSAAVIAAFLCGALCRLPDAAAGEKKRDLPDYDGRGTPSNANVPLLPLKIVFAPVWLVNEVIVRRPLGAVTRAVEKGKLVSKMMDLFTLDKKGNVRLYPSLLLDFGLLPSAGAYFAWDHAMAKENQIRLHAATWGPQWITATALDRLTYDGDRTTLGFRFEFTRRQDLPFQGVGAGARNDDLARYASDLFRGDVSFDKNLGGSHRFASALSVRHRDFGQGTCCGDPTVQARFAEGRFDVPPGFFGYSLASMNLGFTLDTRKEKPAPGSGIRLEGNAEPSFRIDGSRAGFVRASGTAGAALDLTGTQRIVSLSFTMSAVVPLQGGFSAIPFTEQVRYGGEILSGFLPGRLTGASGAALTLQYAWPIWAFMSAKVHAAMGNTFGESFQGLSPKNSRLSFGVGVDAFGNRDHAIEFVLAGGTDTIAQGGELNTLRLVFGTRRGF